MSSFFQGSLNYTTVVTFGDSTSDTGNAYRISNKAWPPVPPFNLMGGFADGLLWNQMFTQKLLMNATLQDYSCDSATTDDQLVRGTINRSSNLVANYSIPNIINVPGVRQQIFQYINISIAKNIDFDRTLYVIWAGFNNYIFNQSITPNETVNSIIQCLNILIFFGARNLVVINQPPFDRFPGFRNPNTTNQTKSLLLKHNKILDEKINQTYLSLNSRLYIRSFDSYTFISNIMNDYNNYGFENLDNCWDTKTNFTIIINCKNITKRIFTDEYHLTSTFQNLFAKQFYTTLAQLNTTSKGISFISTNYYLLLLIVCINSLLK